MPDIYMRTSTKLRPTFNSFIPSPFLLALGEDAMRLEADWELGEFIDCITHYPHE